MAIRKGIEPGMVLFKYIDYVDQIDWNAGPNRNGRDENGYYIYKKVPVYKVIELYSRRARTNGCYIKPWILPYMETLKVRTYRAYSYYDRDLEREVDMHVAVGCSCYSLNKERWDQIEIDPKVQVYYARYVKNYGFECLLQSDEDSFNPHYLQNFQIESVNEEEEDEGLIFEAFFPEYPIYA